MWSERVSTQARQVHLRRSPTKVLAVIGSPRRGHSFQLVRQIEALLRQNGDVEVEIVLLGELNLQPCRGCYVCQSRGEMYCPLADDLVSLVAQMKEADGVILVSPAYTANVSGLMKNLMDRMAWAAHRPLFISKPAMLVVTASMGTSETLRALSWFRFTGFDIVAKVGWPVWPSPRRDWQRGKADVRSLRKAVDRLTQVMSSPRRSLSLMQVMQFYLMKTTPATDPEFFRADDEYYRDIQTLGFKVAWWKKMLGRLSYRIMTGWLDRRLGSKPKGSRSVRQVCTVTDAGADAGLRDDLDEGAPGQRDARPPV